MKENSFSTSPLMRALKTTILGFIELYHKLLYVKFLEKASQGKDLIEDKDIQAARTRSVEDIEKELEIKTSIYKDHKLKM